MTAPRRTHAHVAGSTTTPLRTLLLVLAALLPVLGLLVVAPTATAHDTTPKITFCHATSSGTNPYVSVTTDASSIIKAGHDTHTGPVWNPTLKAQHQSWGDVIPAFDWVDRSGTVRHFAGLNTASLGIIAAGCTIPPVSVTVTAPTSADETCDASGRITIPAVVGVGWKLDGATTVPGVHLVRPGTHSVVATPLTGYVIAGASTWTLTVAAKTSCGTTVVVTPVAPTVTQSPECDVEGSYTIPTTEGVTYLLDGDVIGAGTYSGPVEGTITAVAQPGYRITDVYWEFSLAVAAADTCPVITVVTPVDPATDPSPRCGVEGTYVIASTTGVTYLLDGEPIAAGSYAGPVDGTLTATAHEGYRLSDPEWSYRLNLAEAEACPTVVVVLPVDPSVTQSTSCGIEGSWTIPTTTGVDYLLDGEPIAAGTYDGPADGTVTATAQDGYRVSDPAWSYTLSVAPAETCALPSTGGTLPQTGTPVAPYAGLAAALLLLGTMLVVVSTRRPTVR